MGDHVSIREPVGVGRGWAYMRGRGGKLARRYWIPRRGVTAGINQNGPEVQGRSARTANAPRGDSCPRSEHLRRLGAQHLRDLLGREAAFQASRECRAL